MYKSSKFNYITENKKGELLLFNSYVGTDSFCKILVENKEYIKNIINETKVIDDDSSTIKALFNKGFLIKEEEDEDRKKELLKNETIYNNNLSIIILPTEQCNFRCEYCYESFNKGFMSKELQDAIIRYVRRNINKYQSLHVSWFGGEPTLAMDIIQYLSDQFIEICKKAKKPYTSSITSNGYLLTPENMKTLIKCKVYSYQVTIDGIEEVHNRQKPHITGVKTFQTVINNLIYIRDHIKTNLIEITIRTNISKLLYDRIDEYLEYYSNLFSEDKRFYFFIRPVGDWGGTCVKQMEEHLFNKDSFHLVYDKIINSPYKLQFVMKYFLNTCGSVCYANLRNSFIIDSNGVVRKCTCNLEDERNKIGILNLDGKLDLDQIQIAKWIICSEKEKCNDCSFYGNCLGGSCNWRNNFTNKDDTICPHEKEYINETLILSDQYKEFTIIC